MPLPRRVDEPVKGRCRDRYRAFRRRSVDKHREWFTCRCITARAVRGSRVNVCLSPAAISCDCGNTAGSSEIGKTVTDGTCRRVCRRICRVTLRAVTSAVPTHSITTRKKLVFGTGKRSQNSRGEKKKAYGRTVRVHHVRRYSRDYPAAHMEKPGFIFHSIKRYLECIVLLLNEIQKPRNAPNTSVILYTDKTRTCLTVATSFIEYRF